MSTNDKDDLLRVLEIETSRVCSLDSTIFLIKGWTVALVTGLLAFSSTKEKLTTIREILCLALASALVFMITDLIFRKVQLGHVKTTRRVKKLLIKKSETDEQRLENFSIWKCLWASKYENNDGGILEILKDYFYTLPLYFVVIVGLSYLICK